MRNMGPHQKQSVNPGDPDEQLIISCFLQLLKTVVDTFYQQFHVSNISNKDVYI